MISNKQIIKALIRLPDVQAGDCVFAVRIHRRPVFSRQGPYKTMDSKTIATWWDSFQDTVKIQMSLHIPAVWSVLLLPEEMLNPKTFDYS